MTRFWLDEQEYQAATCWNDCSSEQITNGLALQLAAQAEPNLLKVAHWQIGMIRILTDAPPALLQKLSGRQLRQVLQLVRWAFDDRLQHRPFEEFAHEGVTYRLFADRFADTSAIELAMANIYYLQFANAKADNAKLLGLLVATLCRPERDDLTEFRASKDWTGDRREIYNSIRADERAKLLEKLPIGVSMAVLMYFEAQNLAFLKKYGEVFGADDDDDFPPLYPAGEGWIALLEGVAESGAHGTFKEVCDTNSHTIWLFLKHRAMQAKRQEEQRERDEKRNQS